MKCVRTLNLKCVTAEAEATPDTCRVSSSASSPTVNPVGVLAFAVEEQDDAGYMDVFVSELKHPPAQLCPMPEGLSSQQVCVCVSSAIIIIDRGPLLYLQSVTEAPQASAASRSGFC